MTPQLEHWLSLDLTSPIGTLAIHRASSRSEIELLATRTITKTGDHSESLLPALQEALRHCQISLKQIDRFVTPSGPGSFTGLRIAVASLKAFAFAQKTPIESLSGSEARALQWFKTPTSADYQDLHVLTYITSERFVGAHFKKTLNNNLQFASEKTYTDISYIVSSDHPLVLLDERISVELIPKNIPTFIFPLTASFLGEQLTKSTSRKTYQSLSEWIQLTPTYFGASQY